LSLYEVLKAEMSSAPVGALQQYAKIERRLIRIWNLKKDTWTTLVYRKKVTSTLGGGGLILTFGKP